MKNENSVGGITVIKFNTMVSFKKHQIEVDVQTIFFLCSTASFFSTPTHPTPTDIFCTEMAMLQWFPLLCIFFISASAAKVQSKDSLFFFLFFFIFECVLLLKLSYCWI